MNGSNFDIYKVICLKHLMARFKATDIGCKLHEAALPQAIIFYYAREFIKLWYSIPRVIFGY